MIQEAPNQIQINKQNVKIQKSGPNINTIREYHGAMPQGDHAIRATGCLSEWSRVHPIKQPIETSIESITRSWWNSSASFEQQQPSALNARKTEIQLGFDSAGTLN